MIVSRKEVAFARSHPGQCTMGILSNIQRVGDHDVDPESGTFRLVDWNPEVGHLEPTEFDWAPPAAE